MSPCCRIYKNKARSRGGWGPYKIRQGEMCIHGHGVGSSVFIIDNGLCGGYVPCWRGTIRCPLEVFGLRKRNDLLPNSKLASRVFLYIYFAQEEHPHASSPPNGLDLLRVGCVVAAPHGRHARGRHVFADGIHPLTSWVLGLAGQRRAQVGLAKQDGAKLPGPGSFWSGVRSGGRREGDARAPRG